MGEVASAGINATASGVNTYMQGQSNEAIANKQLEGTKYSSSMSAEASKYSADKQFEAARQQLEYAKQIYGEQSAAYKQAYQKAQEAAAQTSQSLSGGYQSALTEAGKTPEEIQTLKSDILSGNARQLAQGRNQMAANLATSGVRGGQAATLMNRGSGEQTQAATENINQLMANVGQQSKAYQQALLQQKLSGQENSKQALQNFLYNAESAKYSR